MGRTKLPENGKIYRKSTNSDNRTGDKLPEHWPSQWFGHGSAISIEKMT